MRVCWKSFMGNKNLQVHQPYLLEAHRVSCQHQAVRPCLDRRGEIPTCHGFIQQCQTEIWHNNYAHLPCVGGVFEVVLVV